VFKIPGTQIPGYFRKAALLGKTQILGNFFVKKATKRYFSGKNTLFSIIKMDFDG